MVFIFNYLSFLITQKFQTKAQRQYVNFPYCSPFTFYCLLFTSHLSPLISQNFTQSRKAAKTIREFSLPFTVYFLLFTVYYSPLISHLSLLTVHRLLFAILFLKSGINFFHRNFNFFPGYPLVVNSFILLPNNFDKQ